MKKILCLIAIFLISAGSYAAYANVAKDILDYERERDRLDRETVRLIDVNTTTRIEKFEGCNLHKQEVKTTTEYYSDRTKKEYYSYSLLNPDGTVALSNCGSIQHYIHSGVHYLIVGGNRLLWGTNTGYRFSNHKYSSLRALYDQSAIIAKINGKTGLIDVNENSIIPYVYDSLIDAKDGTLSAVLNKKHGILSARNGSVVVPIIYDKFKYVSDNVILAQKGYYYGIIARDGRVIIPVECDKIKSIKLFSPVYSVQKGGLYGIADKYGRVLADIKYKKVKQKDDSLYVSLDGKNWELLDAEIIK